MGENSIIIISESPVNDWESQRLSVVRDLSRVPSKLRDIGTSEAYGIESRDNDGDPDSNRTENCREARARELRKVEERSREATESRSRRNYERIPRRDPARVGVERSEEARESRLKREVEEEEEEEEEVKETEEEGKEEEKKGSKGSKRYRTSRSRGFSSSTSSSCPRLIQRIVLLFLSLLGTPFPSSLSSSQQFSSTTASRGGPVLVSGNSFALVSLLFVVVLLLRPTMAIPTVASAASETGASGGTSTSAASPTFNETGATLARIIQRGKNTVVIGKNEVEEVRDDEVMNFESLGTTTKIRRRRNVEYYTSRQSSNEDEEEEEEEEEEDENEEDEEDAFPASLIPHTRESGHEMRSQLREAELDTIRRSIVEGLGLERIPDPSKANVSQTEYRRAHEEYLTRLQHSRGSGDGRQRRLHTFHPAVRSPVRNIDRTRRSLPPSGTNHDQLEFSSTPEDRVLYFPISIPDEADGLVDHATLRLLLDPTGTPIEISRHVVSLYRRIGRNSRELITRQTLSSHGELSGPRWIELDATKLSSLWQEERTESVVLEVIFESLETGSPLGRHEKQPVLGKPALNIFTTSYPIVEDFRGSRRKRRANPEHLMSLHKGRRTECRGENKKCCRHEMTVIFKDLKGFEFIVQPKNFDAGYCKGRCPPRYNPAHHHALLQSLIWKEDRRKAPRPCCAPSKLDELEILYFDENDPTKLKVSSWKNMKVLECACS